MSNFIIWFGLLIIVIVISTFIHELGHGVSLYLAGIKVSTGFDKVGDLGKKPSDIEFRKSYNAASQIAWDLGVPVTLVLAIIFSNLLRLEISSKVIIVFGAIAYINSLMRLIPCGNALWGLIKRGRLNVEDEVGLGQIWEEKFGSKVLRYVPLFISIIVSIYTLNLTLELLNQKVEWIFGRDYLFVDLQLKVVLPHNRLLIH